MTVNRIIDGNDTIDLSFTTALPKLSTQTLDIRSYIGVIIVPELFCVDANLTLAQKLERGIVYEHTENRMVSSEKGNSGAIFGNRSFGQNITALEFCEYTSKTIMYLDNLGRCHTLA